KHELGNTPAAMPKPSLEAYDAVGVGYRQGFQCYRVVRAEQRGVHPDSERQGDHRKRGETRVANQAQARVPEILQKLFEPDEGAHVPMQFLNVLDTTVGASRQFPRRASTKKEILEFGEESSYCSHKTLRQPSQDNRRMVNYSEPSAPTWLHRSPSGGCARPESPRIWNLEVSPSGGSERKRYPVLS